MGTADKVVRILLVVAIAGLLFTNQVSATVVTELFILTGVFYPHKSIEFLLFEFAIWYPISIENKVKLKIRKKMFESIIRLFTKEKTDYAQLVKDGAVILDVRSKGEYAGGHIKGSVNIAVEQLGSNLHKLKNKTKPIITCCESGMRSAAAKNILKSNGFTNVYNGGGINRLQNKL